MQKPNHTTPIVIGVVGVIGIIAIVLAIVLTRTRAPVVVTAPSSGPQVAMAVDAAVVVPPVVANPEPVPTTTDPAEKPKPTPAEILRTRICARAATGSKTCSAAEICSIDKAPNGYCGCVSQMAEKNAGLYLAWYSCYAGCPSGLSYDGCRANCNRVHGDACSKH